MATYKVEGIENVKNQPIGMNTDYSRVRNGNLQQHLRDINGRVWMNYSSRLDEMVNQHLEHFNVFDMLLPELADEEILEVKSDAQQLKESAEALEKTKPAQEEAVSSSNNALVSVVSAEEKSVPNTAQIQVVQTAKTQRNTGRTMNAGAQDFEPNTRYSFGVGTEDKTVTYAVQTGREEDNKTIQRKMAKTINESGAFQANVIYDSKNNESRLVVSAKETGEKEKFQVFDIEGIAVKTSGIDTVDRDSQDAIYTVNDGPKQHSASNTVSLNEDITIKLHKASPETVRIGAGENKEVATQDVQTFVAGFNQLLNEAQSSKGDGAQRLSKKLVGASFTYAEDLEGAGIAVNLNGSLAMDDDKLQIASEQGKLTELVQKSSGFISRVHTIAQEVAKNPASYISDYHSPEAEQTIVTDYGPLGEFTFANHYPANRVMVDGLFW